MSGREHEAGHRQRPVTRRSVLRASSGLLLGLTAWTGAAAAQSTPGFDGWFEKTKNYQGIVDETGASSVTVSVGPPDVSGGPLVFGPAAIRVDPGTTVTWEWTGEGGNHNVVASDGTFESELTDEAGFTFDYTFEDPGVYRYYCSPHKAVGMRGAVIVGDVELGAGGLNLELPGSEFQQTFLGIIFGLLSLSILTALLPDIPRVAGFGGRVVGRIGYGIHWRSGFRSRPVGATIVGWLTFGTVLMVLGAAVIGLWFVGAGPMGLLVGLAALALLVAVYVGTSAEVSILPSFGGGRVHPTAGNPGRSLARTARGTSSVRGRYDLTRTMPVVRGWIVIALLITVAAAGAVGLWQLTKGPLGLLIGLGVLVGLGAWYGVSTTW